MLQAGRRRHVPWRLEMDDLDIAPFVTEIVKYQPAMATRGLEFAAQQTGPPVKLRSIKGLFNPAFFNQGTKTHCKLIPTDLPPSVRSKQLLSGGQAKFVHIIRIYQVSKEVDQVVLLREA